MIKLGTHEVDRIVAPFEMFRPASDPDQIGHDLYFIERFATGLWALEGGTIRTYVDLPDMKRERQEPRALRG